MSKDISRVLEGWEFDPERISVRLIQGDDGREKVQLRIDMGLMQMERDGRPDGTRPHGFESLLEYFQHAVEQYRQKYGNVDDFRLDSDDCAALMREGIQYYHRYLALFQLERFDLVARDTQRNLRLFEFVRRYADSDEDKWRFDQYRPYVLMMHTRALAHLALQRKDYNEALVIVEEGLAKIREFLRQYEQEEHADQCAELQFLEWWRRQIASHRPVDKTERLEQELAEAVQKEQYERAAQLRDELQRLRQQTGPGPGAEAVPPDTA